MKSFFGYLVISALAIGMMGCGDFLEESSLDEVRPSTVTELEQLLLGEGYLRRDQVAFYIELLTDNVQSSFSPNVNHRTLLQRGAPAFTWDPDMFEKMDELHITGIDTWEKLYSKIKGCNVVLDMLDKVSGAEESKLNQKGQALGLRAYYYFILVNTFAQPYNKEGLDLNTALGVPLILESAVKDEFPPRESVAKVYRQIETDLLEAAELLDKYGQDNIMYKVTPLFVSTLLSRMYLYMENWEKAAEYASKVIERKPQLRKLSDYVKIEIDEWFGDEIITYDKENGGVYNFDSPELIFGFGIFQNDEIFFQFPDIGTYPGSLPVFAVSEKFISQHGKDDLRSHFYYQEYFKMIFPPVRGILRGNKSFPDNYSNPSQGMRVAESYLNRAEANIRLFMENGEDEYRVSALNDLNYLRAHRFKQPYNDVNIADGRELLDFCLEERRKELAFEEHRWFDLRRCEMPELVHEMTFTQGQVQEYRLAKGSNRYVLPIPKKVLDKNPALVQNP